MQLFFWRFDRIMHRFSNSLTNKLTEFDNVTHRFLIGDSAPQTDSGIGIWGPSGPQIPTPESVWGAEFSLLIGAETSAGICGHLINFCGPQKLGIQNFQIYFIIFMLFEVVYMVFKGILFPCGLQIPGRRF